jgi:hypothetical protein
MTQFVGGEIGRLITLAYRGRAANEANTGRLMEALLGPRDFEHESLVRTMKVRLHDNIERQVKLVADYLRVYDGVFHELTQDGNATAFRDFLLRSPEMLMALGEGAGVVSHIASFWRFRFPTGQPLEANVGELLDILQDFEAGLGGEASALAA